MSRTITRPSKTVLQPLHCGDCSLPLISYTNNCRLWYFNDTDWNCSLELCTHSLIPLCFMLPNTAWFLLSFLPQLCLLQQGGSKLNHSVMPCFVFNMPHTCSDNKLLKWKAWMQHQSPLNSHCKHEAHFKLVKFTLKLDGWTFGQLWEEFPALLWHCESLMSPLKNVVLLFPDDESCWFWRLWLLSKAPLRCVHLWLRVKCIFNNFVHPSCRIKDFLSSLQLCLDYVGVSNWYLRWLAPLTLRPLVSTC